MRFKLWCKSIYNKTIQRATELGDLSQLYYSEILFYIKFAVASAHLQFPQTSPIYSLSNIVVSS